MAHGSSAGRPVVLWWAQSDGCRGNLLPESPTAATLLSTPSEDWSPGAGRVRGLVATLSCETTARIEMARRGKKRRLGLEDEYWKLIADGVGTVMACQQLRRGRVLRPCRQAVAARQQRKHQRALAPVFPQRDRPEHPLRRHAEPVGAHMGVKTIARRLGLARNTVRSALAADALRVRMS
jgi:hypothetical protein